MSNLKRWKTETGIQLAKAKREVDTMRNRFKQAVKRILEKIGALRVTGFTINLGCIGVNFDLASAPA